MKHKRAPYDEVYSNKLYLETLEDILTSNVIRGGKFSFLPDAIIEVPKKEVLRKNIDVKYGIKNIDEYFIPVIVDKLSYWNLTGESEPNLFETRDINEYISKQSCLCGHVYPIDNFYLSFISTSLDTDIAIEHEALHAYVFKHSPNFKNIRGRDISHLWSSFMSKEQEGWSEAISWVMTSKSFDIENVFKNYDVDQKPKNLNIFKRALTAFLLPSSAIANQVSFLAKDFSNPNYKYKSLKSLIEHVNGFSAVFSLQKNYVPSWQESFYAVQKIKNNYSIHDAVNILGTNSRSDVLRMLR